MSKKNFLTPKPPAIQFGEKLFCILSMDGCLLKKLCLFIYISLTIRKNYIKYTYILSYLVWICQVRGIPSQTGSEILVGHWLVNFWVDYSAHQGYLIKNDLSLVAVREVQKGILEPLDVLPVLRLHGHLCN